MESKKDTEKNIYDTIVIGAGASGLFYAASDSASDIQGGLPHGRKLILEKTSRPGTKLLMSGNGMCNITHAGSIKDFIAHYGDNGRLIRSCLYRHSNLELMDMIGHLGVPVTTREDGKVFPSSMKASDVLDALTRKTRENGWDIRTGAEATEIEDAEDNEDQMACITLKDGTRLKARKLVIAAGGCSYPSTGSDGSLFEVLKRDLGLDIIEPHPALTPVYVQDFSYGDLSGVSFDDVRVTSGSHTTTGPMLITHRGFSGPAVLHISQYVRPGADLTVNYIPGETRDTVSEKLKKDQPGNRTGIGNYLSSSFGLPKAFVSAVIHDASRSISSIPDREIDEIAGLFTEHHYSVSGTGGWNDAMVTAGGVSLDQIDLKNMRVKGITSDIRIIGEALDINGDTGGYNLQFAYSSAMAAIE